MLSLVLISVVLCGGWALPLGDNGRNPLEGDYFEGDIRLTEGAPELDTVMPQLNRRWPKVMPYTIGKEFNADERQGILNAIETLNRDTRVNGQTCVEIVPRGSEPDYVQVIRDTGCYSYIGRINGMQELALTTGCINSIGAAMHEFLHAFGFRHEHSRPDRDDFVDILFENIADGKESNFIMLEEGTEVDLLGTTYDYGSVMHYGKTFFSSNGQPTIVPKDPNAEIGQQRALSALDIERVQIFHCCITPRESKYHQHMSEEAYADYCANFP